MSHSAFDSSPDLASLEQCVLDEDSARRLATHLILSVSTIPPLVILLDLAADGLAAASVIWCLTLALQGCILTYNAQQAFRHIRLKFRFKRIAMSYQPVNRAAHERFCRVSPLSFRFWSRVAEWLSEERKSVDSRRES